MAQPRLPAYFHDHSQYLYIFEEQAETPHGGGLRGLITTVFRDLTAGTNHCQPASAQRWRTATNKHPDGPRDSFTFIRVPSKA